LELQLSADWKLDVNKPLVMVKEGIVEPETNRTFILLGVALGPELVLLMQVPGLTDEEPSILGFIVTVLPLLVLHAESE
jgi:hypothetical protein